MLIHSLTVETTPPLPIDIEKVSGQSSHDPGPSSLASTQDRAVSSSPDLITEAGALNISAADEEQSRTAIVNKILFRIRPSPSYPQLIPSEMTGQVS